MAKTLLVSNRLPVQINEAGKPIRTTGGLASALQAIESEDKIPWVGWSGAPLERTEDPEHLRSELRKIDLEPVFLSEDQVNGFYEGYSNATLWPLLHYMSQRSRFEPGWFEQYQSVNEQFAEAVARIANDGDTVWIHDYHLFLLPAMLRKINPQLKIGFFLHTPFPSSDIFRILPERKEILLGILGANLIGFHTFNYLRHFRSALLRVLGLETEHDHLYHEGHKPRLGVYPIGHDAEGFRHAMGCQKFVDAQKKLLTDLDGKKLILNVERLDYTKGVPEKLAAIRLFLNEHPEKKGQVMFLIIAVPSRQNVEEYAELTESVQREVGAINGDFGTIGNAPIHFLHRSFPPEELAAFYSLADVCMVTPLVDGMNLVAKEYIDCKREEISARPGALILSEFAGAAAEMSHAILINPYDVKGVSQAIAQALALPHEDMWDRVHAMQDHLTKNDAGVWAKRFLSYFDKNYDREAGTDHSENLSDTLSQISVAAKENKKIALFLDYDGTLRGFTTKPEDAIPDPELIPLLRRIADKASISIVSGRPMKFLDQHFSGNGFTLVSEHGYRMKKPGEQEWQLINPHVDITWKELVYPQLQQAAELTPNTNIEEKPSSLVWHYRAADPGFGDWQAHRLLSELTDITASLPVAVHHGKKIVEISSLQVSKGAAVEAIIETMQPHVVLTAGDDQTDESMFMLSQDVEQHHSIHVGSNDTRASKITSIKGFRRFLEALATQIHS